VAAGGRKKWRPWRGELRGGAPLLVGVATLNPAPIGRPLFNSAVLLRDGEVGPAFHKMLLPTYDVFDEDRYFEPAAEPQILELGGWRLGISICEDVWNDRDFWERPRYHSDPIAVLAQAGAQAVIIFRRRRSRWANNCCASGCSVTWRGNTGCR